MQKIILTGLSILVSTLFIGLTVKTSHAQTTTTPTMTISPTSSSSSTSTPKAPATGHGI